MAIQFPKGVRSQPLQAETKQPVGIGAAPVTETAKPVETSGDGVLPGVSQGVRERHTPPQGNSLIERAERYLGQQIAKTEARLAPLIAQLQTNGWFSLETLATIGRSGSKEEIAALIRQSSGASSLGTNTDLDRLSDEILKSPASASSVLLLSTSGAAIAELGGALTDAAQGPLRELINHTRHLDNLSTWVDKGYTQYLSLDQMKTELDASKVSGVQQFCAAIAPVTLADVNAAQTAYQSASGASTAKARDAGQAKVLDQFTQAMSALPEKLWSELNAQGSDVRDRLETLLQRGPYGPEFEQGRNIVSSFMTDGREGARLHEMFGKAIDLEYFIRGGYIPDVVARGSELWS